MSKFRLKIERQEAELRRPLSFTPLSPAELELGTHFPEFQGASGARRHCRPGTAIAQSALSSSQRSICNQSIHPPPARAPRQPTPSLPCPTPGARGGLLIAIDAEFVTLSHPVYGACCGARRPAEYCHSTRALPACAVLRGHERGRRLAFFCAGTDPDNGRTITVLPARQGLARVSVIRGNRGPVSASAVRGAFFGPVAGASRLGAVLPTPHWACAPWLGLSRSSRTVLSWTRTLRLRSRSWITSQSAIDLPARLNLTAIGTKFSSESLKWHSFVVAELFLSSCSGAKLATCPEHERASAAAKPSLAGTLASSRATWTRRCRATT